MILFRLFVHARRESRAENSGATVLREPLADATSGNPAGAGQAISGDIGICAQVRRVQDENTGDTERLQLLSENTDKGVTGAAGQRREGPDRRQRARQPNVLVLRPRDTHASGSESRDHYLLDGCKWYRLSLHCSRPRAPVVTETIIDPARCQLMAIRRNSAVIQTFLVCAP